jgi:hypothetical protein
VFVAFQFGESDRNRGLWKADYFQAGYLKREDAAHFTNLLRDGNMLQAYLRDASDFPSMTLEVWVIDSLGREVTE